MLLASRTHTEGDSRRWIVSYDRWLDNAAEIDEIEVLSSSPTCTVTESSILGRDVVFFLNDGIRGETLTVTVKMTDNFGNIKTDTIAFTVLPP